MRRAGLCKRIQEAGARKSLDRTTGLDSGLTCRLYEWRRLVRRVVCVKAVVKCFLLELNSCIFWSVFLSTYIRAGYPARGCRVASRLDRLSVSYQYYPVLFRDALLRIFLPSSVDDSHGSLFIAISISSPNPCKYGSFSRTGVTCSNHPHRPYSGQPVRT